MKKRYIVGFAALAVAGSASVALATNGLHSGNATNTNHTCTNVSINSTYKPGCPHPSPSPSTSPSPSVSPTPSATPTPTPTPSATPVATPAPSPEVVSLPHVGGSAQ